MTAEADPTLLRQCLRGAARAVSNAADELNQLDAVAGDGDLGITMASASRIVETQLDLEPRGDPAGVLFGRIGVALAREVPSTSGTLVATGFLRAAKATKEGAPDLVNLIKCMTAATEGIMDRGKAELGDKTMVDVLVPVCDELRAAELRGADLGEALTSALARANTAVDATADMVPRRGRASWMVDNAAGHPDGGCRLIAIGLGAALSALQTSE